jgi:hypothetical protein
VSREYDPFFDDEPEAVDFCNGQDDDDICPIRESCARFALTNNEKAGVWGGYTELQRRWIRKEYPLRGKEPRPEWNDIRDRVPSDEEIMLEWGIVSKDDLDDSDLPDD